MSEPEDDPGRRPTASVHRDTRRHAQDQQQEVEALRGRVISLEAEKARLLAQLQAVRLETDRLGHEQASLERCLAEVRGESVRFARAFVEVERQNANLANLYVASDQLHGTLDRGRVLEVIQEILANLVGSEETAVFERDEAGGALRLVSSNGIEREAFAHVACGEGVIGRVVATGETWIAGEGGAAGGRDEALTACVPLRLEDRVTGAIAIFRLLPQKNGLEACDRELFDLLATHAAVALYCAGLRRTTTA